MDIIEETMITRDFVFHLAKGEYDDGETAAIVSTSYPGMAAAIRKEASYRGIALKILVLEYDDVQTDSPASFTDGMAYDVVAFLGLNPDSKLVFVCDGGVSRSSAMLAAALRIKGRSDLIAVWANPKYYPNILVYRRLLAAVHENLAEADVASLNGLKEAKQLYKIQRLRRKASAK